MAFTYDIAQLPSEGEWTDWTPIQRRTFVRLLLNDTQEAQARTETGGRQLRGVHYADEELDAFLLAAGGNPWVAAADSWDAHRADLSAIGLSDEVTVRYTTKMDGLARTWRRRSVNRDAAAAPLVHGLTSAQS